MALKAQIADQQKVADDKKAKREDLRQHLVSLKIILPEGSEESPSLDSNAQGQLQRRQQDLYEAQQDATHRRVLYDSTKNLSDDAFVATMAGMGRLSSSLTGLQTDILNQESTIQNLLKQGFAEDHPRVQAVQAQLAQERDQFKTLIAGARNALKIDADMADAGVKEIQADVDKLQNDYGVIQTKEILPFIDADKEYQHEEGLLETLKIKLKEIQSNTPLLESPVKLISKADPPDFPSSPPVNLYIALSAGLGLGCGIVVAFLIEYLDTSVKTMADAEIAARFASAYDHSEQGRSDAAHPADRASTACGGLSNITSQA